MRSPTFLSLCFVILNASLGLEASNAAQNLSYTTRIPIPSGLNQGLTSPPPSFMLTLLGPPGPLTKDCSPSIDPHLAKLIVTQNVGPFRVTGLKPAVSALQRIFARVKHDKPDLYARLGTAGMLCIRAVRNSSPMQYSNHSWGAAVDLTVSNILVPYRANYTLYGLSVLYPYFHAERFDWGAGFAAPNTDPMHFEASQELLESWRSDRLLGSP
jgi:hypothetical protein